MIMKKSAIITASLAAGSTAAAPFYDVNIKRQLPSKTCVASAPVFAPAFSVLSVTPVGESQHEILVHVSGTINYHGCRQCEATQVVVSQSFLIPVYSATAIESATITAGVPQNRMIPNGCKPCSTQFESNIPITVAITTA